MKRFLVLSIVFAVTLSPYILFATDFSKYSTEELSNMRGTMQNATVEERNAFRTEWQKRIQNMSQEERQKYLGSPSSSGSQYGTGQKQGGGKGRGMGKGRKW